LKDYLIPSTLIPLSLEQARALSRSYEASYMGKPPLSPVEVSTLESLSVLIDQEAEKWKPGISSNGFFVRLNTRSPKDALILSKEMFAAVEEDKKKLESEGGSVTENDILRFCYVNFVKKMIVHSGKEATRILGLSHRIWQDINSAIDSIIDKFEMFVVVREWAQIHPSAEFRGFVYGKKLNAISSYNRAVCWPGIPERKDEITNRCIAFWEEIKGKVPEELDNFVIDFAFLDNGLGDVTIVEFNDFADFEGAGSNAELFSWCEDSDVLKGIKPFETRLVMSPLTREQLEVTLTKPFRIHLGWDDVSSWRYGVDWY